MGTPIVRKFDSAKTILKFNDFKGFACVVDSTIADSNGIVKAGTPYPADGATCKGYILHDTDVSRGSAPATAIYEGAIDNAKIAGVTIGADSKKATPRVTFFD